jgi:hypothetical protein
MRWLKAKGANLELRTRAGDALITDAAIAGDVVWCLLQLGADPMPPGARLSLPRLLQTRSPFKDSPIYPYKRYVWQHLQQMRIARIEAGGDAPMALTTLSAAFALPSVASTWAWQRADVLALTSQVRESISKTLKHVHAALLRRDADALLQFGAHYFAEYAQAYPQLSESQRADRFCSGLRPRSDDPSWKLADLQPEQFDFRLCAGGRLDGQFHMLR